MEGAGDRVGNWSMSANECVSGKSVELWGSGKVVRVGDDDLSGPFIEVPTLDGSDPIALRRRDCRVLDVDSHYNGITIRQHDEYDGSVDADCDLPGGGKLAAKVKFQNCYW